MITTMISGGLRVGAWDFLSVRDLEPCFIDGKLVCAKLTVYRGEPEEYQTRISLEAYNELKSYLDLRRESGERITPETPLIRDLWMGGGDKHAKGEIHIPKRLRATSVKRLLEDAWRANPNLRRKEEGKKRFNIRGTHFGRKYFETACLRAGLTPWQIKIFRGDILPVDLAYQGLTEEELTKVYLRAMPELQIFELGFGGEAVSEEIETLKRRVSDLQKTIEFATRQNITKEIRTCLKNYFGAISQEDKERKKARLLQGFGFTEGEIREIERLHNAVYEELKIPSHIKDKEEYLSEQFRRIGERPRLKELFTDYFARINEATERVYQMTKSRTSGQANFF
jgi:hypothetical protein